jgi:hypothetical protein
MPGICTRYSLKSAKISKSSTLPGPSHVLRETGRRPDAGVKIIVLFCVTPCSLVHKYQRFRGICCLCIQNTWNMEAVRSPKAWHLSINVHGVTSQTVCLLIFCSGRFQNLGLYNTKCFPDQWRINWKGCGRKRIAYNLMLWLNICLEWLKNTTKHLGHDRLSANQTMNPEICVLVSRNTPKTVILRRLLLSMKPGQPFEDRNTDWSCLRAYVGETMWKWSEEPEIWGNCTTKIEKVCSFSHISIISL